jgi:hypothetical protein
MKKIYNLFGTLLFIGLAVSCIGGIWDVKNSGKWAATFTLSIVFVCFMYFITYYEKNPETDEYEHKKDKP